MEEQDLTNFSTSSSSHHRLPTISASEAVQNASARSSRSISTGLPSLDSALGRRPNSSTTAGTCNGLPRGSVTEIYGPPGVGKTAFAIQAAVNALHSYSRSSSGSSARRNEVVWIDTGAPLPGPRFEQVLSAAYQTAPPTTQTQTQTQDQNPPPSSPPAIESAPDLLDRVHYLDVPTLAHLLVLFLHPTPNFPPPDTALVVVDNVSALFTTSFPRPGSVDRSHATSTSTSSAATTAFAESARSAAQRKAANRKWAVAGDLAGAMARMAQLHDCAVLVVNQVATSLKGGTGGGGGGVRKAMLKPSLAGNGWDAGVQSRILLYRDFAPRRGKDEDDDHGSAEISRDRDGKVAGMRFAEVVKVSGKMVGPGTGAGIATTTTGAVVPFVIEDAGLREIQIRSLTSSSPTSTPLTSSIATEGEQDKTLKRKADEIADSEDDEEDGLGSEDDLGVLPDDFLA